MRTTQSTTSAHLIATTSLTRPTLLALLAAGTVLSPVSAFALDDGALPTGENVVGGSATFDRSVPNLLNINQGTDRLVVNWASFNIGKSATTEFFQPNAGSLAVNRVVGGNSDPTQILGTLKANGRVMVLDPNGVLFGAGSVIDVGSIVASTGSVDTDAVMSGGAKIVLSNLGAGSVVNEGLVKVADGGLAAFVAPTVRNSGIISAKLGKVVLAAGTESATVDLYGDGLVELAVSGAGAKVLADNAGTIDAEGGTVLMTASAAKDVVDTVVNMSGVVNASSATMKGGKIILSAGGGKAKVSGKLDASGEGAGSVAVTGGDVELTETSEIAANGGENGDGGNVYVYGDRAAIFRGSILAQGGSVSGNGGLVEVSTLGDLTFAGFVNTLAANGAAGSLVIDPTTMTIHSGSLDWLIGSANYMSNELLAGLLGWNGLVTIQATSTVNVGTTSGGMGVGTGDVDVSSYSYWWFGWHTQTTNGNLKLQAPTVNFVKDLTMGNGSVLVDATTLNLNSEVYGKDGASTVLLGDDRLNSTGALGTINVLSPNAKIQQGISFANNGAAINVAAGTYAESVLVNKSVGLYGTGAIITPNSPGFHVTANGVTIDGFAVDGASGVDGYGIWLDNVDNSTLTDNVVTNSAQAGIYGSGIGGTNLIGGNTVTGTGGNGIQISGNDAGSATTLSNNTISNIGWDGIQIANGAGNVTASGNTISNVTGASGIAVMFQGGDVDLLGNTVNGADRLGVYVWNSDGLMISGNTINDTGREGADWWTSGVHLEGANNTTVSGNTISNASNGGDGVRIGGGNAALVATSGNVIDGNTISLVGDDGVDAQNSNGVSVTNNYIHDVADNGVHIEGGSDALVEYNYIESTGWDGVKVELTEGAKVLNNTIKDVARAGVAALDAVSTLIDGNETEDTDMWGVYVRGGSDTTVTDNTISDTPNGVWATGTAQLWVDGNAIDHNDDANDPAGGAVGVHVDGSSNVQIGEGGFSGNNGNRIDDFATGIEVDGVTNGAVIDANDITDANNGIVASSVSSLVIADNDIDGRTYSGRGSGDGIRVTDSDWARIGGVNDGNTVRDFYGNGISLIDSDHVLIGNNTVYNISGNGIFVDPSDYVEIAFNDVHDIGADGVHVDDGAYGNVHHNTVQNVGGDGVDVNDNYDADIHHNTVYNTGDNGIEVSGSLGADIYGNDIDEVDGDGIHVSSSDWADIYDNEINTHRGGANTESDGIEVENSDHVDIWHNTIDDTDHVGIDLHGTDHVWVYDNLITDAHTGIRLNDSDIDGAVVDDNTVRNVEYGVWAKDVGNLVVTDNDIDGRYMTSGDGEVGIYVEDSYNALIGGWKDGNTVEDFEVGIRVVDSASADVEYNDVSEFDDYGIWVSSSDFVDVKNNNVYDGEGTGVRVYSSDWAEINDNDVDDVDEHGIELVDSDYVDILRNTVDDAGQHGVFVDPSDHVEIAWNTIHDSGWDGIHIDDGHDASVYNNHVGRSGNDGIDINDNDGVSVRSNYVHDSRDNGIEVSDSWDADVRYNTVENSGGDGIEVSSSAFADVRNNEVRNSGDDGIDVDGSYMVDVNDNHVHGARVNGIEVTNSYDADVDGNRVHYTGEDGIYVENSDYADVRNNEVHDTGDDGVDVRGGRGVDIVSNNIWNTQGDGIQVRFSEGVDVSWNEIEESEDDGIDVQDSSRASVTHNRVHDVDNNGIEVENSWDAEVSYNHVGDVWKGDGIYVAHSDFADVRGNYVHDVRDDGIDIHGGFGVDVVGNETKDTGGDGIQVRWSRYVDVLWNKILGAGDDGIDVQNSDDADVKGNFVHFVRNNGIEVEDSDNADIMFNHVGFAGYDGIHVEGGNNAFVGFNKVHDSGHDGISVSNLYGYGGPAISSLSVMGGPVYSFYNARVIGNTVSDSGNHGIASYEVPNILIGWNKVSNSGFSGYDTFSMEGRGGPGHYNRGGDGIHVEVTGGDRKGGDILVDILGNDVTNSRDDGIDVDYTHQGRHGHDGGDSYGPTLLSSESMDYEGDGGPYVRSRVDINIHGNTVYDSGDDGIVVKLHGDHKDGYNDYPGPVGFSYMESGRDGGHGRGVTAINVDIRDNTVDNPVDVYNPEMDARVMDYDYGRGDGIQVDAYFSPWARIVTDTTVSDNTVSNSGENGIYISGPSHDFVTLAGNILTDNPVGMHFESGEIDLTGDANTINGGDVGMLFRPYLLGYEYGYPEIGVKTMMYPPMMGDPIYAPMSLVDNTIGSTVFNGQGTYYVELDNGAFFEPGQPTILNGLDAAYDGFRPASYGGVLTQAQYNHLESMIYHYRDDVTLGLFFFGAVPQLGGISQEDILRLFGGFNPNSPSGGLIVTGLPRIGGAGGAPAGGAGGIAGFLANITPAAGDEEEGTGDGGNVADIEPAAGGDVSDAACWDDATNKLGQGTPVSYSFGDEASGLLDKAAACGQGL
jgi:filamentous hemagglutinin family protein